MRDVNLTGLGRQRWVCIRPGITVSSGKLKVTLPNVTFDVKYLARYNLDNMGTKTRLKRFRVQNFRSVADSGWINVDSVAAMVGVNESGKTNLLLPLWKLKPARDGEIDLIADAPRKRFTEIRSTPENFTFIEAEFELSDIAAGKIATLASTNIEEVRVVKASRRFNGATDITFPEEAKTKTIASTDVQNVVDVAKTDIGSATASGKGDQIFQGQSLEVIDQATKRILPGERQDQSALNGLFESLSTLDVHTAPAKSNIKPIFEALLVRVKSLLNQVGTPTAGNVKEARSAALSALPSFIYYSTYGNLDSEIYLPHVIENLERDDLRGKEAAKARTLRVLFDFVQLKPAEILALGEEKQPSPQTGQKLQSVIDSEAKQKKEREVLLQSASSTLTTKFEDWWKQGTYRFRLQADGRHFRIWVSDGRRPEEIELEGRSTGLQWFLSFYLVFLVEKDNAHEDCILLLDEPGHSLHPLAQKDLIAFFHSLSNDSQILYTTHSPFLVDSNRLDDVLAVYVDTEGHTQASTDLRVSEIGSDRDRSIYPVHAAVGLSVSDILLQGCDPIVCEGPSDQVYLSLIKGNFLKTSSASTDREMVFIPAKGTRSIKALTAILSGTSSKLPVVLLDSDSDGRVTAEQLKKELYASSPGRVLTLADIGIGNDREIEDVMPRDLIIDAVSREFKQIESDFEQFQNPAEPIVGEIERWAASANYELPCGWKVSIARRVRQRAEQRNIAVPDTWKKLFGVLTAAFVTA